MKKLLAFMVSAPLLVAAAPYTNDQLANGFARLVAAGKTITPLMSAEVPEDVAANLVALAGCEVSEVETLRTKYVGYGIQWECRKKPKGIKNAAVIKIQDGKIYQILMSDMVNG